MNRRALQRLGGPGFVLLAFVGLWASHTIEFVRSGAPGGLGAALLRSPHLYMLPSLLLLLSLSVVAGARAWRGWTRLAARLDRARAALLSPWVPPPERDWSDLRQARLSLWSLWPPLTALQLLLYVTQENLEASLRGAPMPGMGVFSGVHQPALLVHAVVGLLLASLALGLHRRFARRIEAVGACEKLVRAIRRHRLVSPAPALRPLAVRLSPVESHGRQLWRRPPPYLQ